MSPGPGRIRVLLLLALLLRVWGLAFNISVDGGWVGAWHADEYGLWNKAALLWPDLDPHYWGYPALHLYILGALNAVSYAGASVLGLSSDLAYHPFLDAVPGLRYLLGRGLSVFAGVGTIALLARHGHRVAGEMAFLGAIFLATCPLHIQHSHYATLDALLTLLVTVAALAQLRLTEDHRWAIPAGLLAGLAFAEKYNAGVLLVSLPIAAWWGAKRSGGRPFSAVTRSLGAAALVAGVVNVFFFLHFDSSWPEFAQNFDRVVRLDAGSSGIHPWLDYTKMLGAHTGWGLIALSVVGLAGLLRTHRERGSVLVLVLCTYIALVGSLGLQVPRYILPIVPLLCLLAANGCGVVGRVAGRVVPSSGRRLPLLLGLCVIGEMLPTTRNVLAIFGAPDTRMEASRWLAHHLPPGVRIAIESEGEYGPTLVEDRWDAIPYSFLIGQPMYGPFVANAEWLLVGEREGEASEAGIGVGSPRAAMVLSGFDPGTADERAAEVAQTLGLDRWSLLENVPTGDFAALQAQAPLYVATTEWMYGNPETGNFQNYYDALWADETATLVARFPSRPYDHSVHHPEIRIYHLGRRGPRTGEDQDGYYPRDGGHAFVMDVPPGLLSDTSGAVGNSRLSILEDGVPLGPPHQRHDVIRGSGGGRYSHWQGRIFFSTSDGTDPNVNGRVYSWVELR